MVLRSIKIGVITGALLIGSVIAPFVPSHSASAAQDPSAETLHYGRYLNQGYFSGQRFSTNAPEDRDKRLAEEKYGDVVLDDGLKYLTGYHIYQNDSEVNIGRKERKAARDFSSTDHIENIISEMHALYKEGHRENDRYKKVGPAFIINTMMGNNAPGVTIEQIDSDIDRFFDNARQRLYAFVATGGQIKAIASEIKAGTPNGYVQFAKPNALRDARRDGFNNPVIDAGFHTITGDKRRMVVAFIDRDGKIIYELNTFCGNIVYRNAVQQPDNEPNVTFTVDCDGLIRGTAVDPDSPNTKLSLEIWRGTRESGTKIAPATGQTLIADSNFGGSNNNGFLHVYNQIRSGDRITVYARNIDNNGTPTQNPSVATWSGASRILGDCPADYTVIPVVTSTTSTVFPGSSATFDGSLRNDGNDATNSPLPGGRIPYEVKTFIIPPSKTDGVDNGPDYTPWDDASNSSYVDTYNKYLTRLDLSVGARDCQTVSAMSLYLPGTQQNGECLVTARTGTVDIDALSTISVPIPDQPTDNMEPGTKICVHISVDYAQAGGGRHRWSRPSCVTIAKIPSLKVTAGDVAVGRAGDPNAKIVTLTSMLTSQCYGSWQEYGLFAPNTINSASGASVLANSCSPAQKSRLSFANNSANPGNFDIVGVRTQLGNNRIADTVTNLSGNQTINLSTYTPGSYEVNISGTAIVRGQLRAGVSLHLQAQDVVVNGNIRYQDIAYSSLEQLPQLILHARNNITINANVSTVTGWLVAGTQSGSEGIINTCNTDTPNAGGNYYDNLTLKICNTPLRIDGTINAKKLYLRRTAGSNGTSITDRRQTAEHINLRGDVYLWANGTRGVNNGYIIQNLQELAPRS